jgi:hypothetical protein
MYRQTEYPKQVWFGSCDLGLPQGIRLVPQPDRQAAEELSQVWVELWEVLCRSMSEKFSYIYRNDLVRKSNLVGEGVLSLSRTHVFYSQIGLPENTVEPLDKTTSRWTTQYFVIRRIPLTVLYIPVRCVMYKSNWPLGMTWIHIKTWFFFAEMNSVWHHALHFTN